MTDERRNKVLVSTRSEEAGGRGGVPPPPGLDAARAMALDGLARAFEDAVRAVWYASWVRDDARR